MNTIAAPNISGSNVPPNAPAEEWTRRLRPRQTKPTTAQASPPLARRLKSLEKAPPRRKNNRQRKDVQETENAQGRVAKRKRLLAKRSDGVNQKTATLDHIPVPPHRKPANLVDQSQESEREAPHLENSPGHGVPIAKTPEPVLTVLPLTRKNLKLFEQNLEQSHKSRHK